MLLLAAWGCSGSGATLAKSGSTAAHASTVVETPGAAVQHYQCLQQAGHALWGRQHVVASCLLATASCRTATLWMTVPHLCHSATACALPAACLCTCRRSGCSRHPLHGCSVLLPAALPGYLTLSAASMQIPSPLLTTWLLSAAPAGGLDAAGILNTALKNTQCGTGRQCRTHAIDLSYCLPSFLLLAFAPAGGLDAASIPYTAAQRCCLLSSDSRCHFHAEVLAHFRLCDCMPLLLQAA